MQVRLFDIQRFSIHDGPGIRTNVFFKGCPLRCLWCHNPESARFDVQTLYYAQKCNACGSCAKVCPAANSVLNGRHRYDRASCTTCGICAKVCPQEAFKLVGYDMNTNDLLLKIARDRVFYDETGGGVTFTGGEPLAQPEELREIATLCKSAAIHTAIETSLMASRQVVEEAFPAIDLWICDIKAYSGRFHKKLTGSDNALILSNFNWLAQRAIQRMWVRIPLITGINDSKAELEQIAELLSEKPFGRVELMPYHDIGMSKYAALGMRYATQGVTAPNGEKLDEVRSLLRGKGVMNVV